MGGLFDSGALLTVDQVRAWLLDRGKKRALLATTAADLEVLDRKLNGVMAILDEPTRRSLFGDEPPAPTASASGPSHGNGPATSLPDSEPETREGKERRKRGQSDGDWVVELLLRRETGLFESEIWAEAQNYPALKLYGKPERAVRAMLESLARRGKIRRRSTVLYHPLILQRIENGELKYRDGGDAEPKVAVRSLIRQAICDLGGSARAGDIMTQLGKMPEAVPILARNTQYPYAMLSRMALGGELDREGKVYTLPKDSNGVEANASSVVRFPLSQGGKTGTQP